MADDKTKVGALWQREGSRGTYHMGTIDAEAVKMALGQGKTKLIVFGNGYKTEDKHPDLIVYLADPKPVKA